MSARKTEEECLRDGSQHLTNCNLLIVETLQKRFIP